jgi:hypothetical protein
MRLEDLETVICAQCAFAFAVDGTVKAAWLARGIHFWCPNGHENYFKPPPSEADQLKAKIADLEAQLRRALLERDAARKVGAEQCARADAAEKELELWRPQSA